MTAKNKKPVFDAVIWPVKAAVWENRTDDGKNTFYSVTVERTYKEGDEWKSTSGFNRDDLLKLAKCADAAHTWILRQEARTRQATSGDE